MKIYIQNGFNKRVCNFPNYSIAAKYFIKSLIVTDSEGNEIVELSPITLVSKRGFFKDLQEMDMLDGIDEMRCLNTAEVLNAIGRKDIAKFVKALPKDAFTKSLLSS